MCTLEVVDNPTPLVGCSTASARLRALRRQESSSIQSCEETRTQVAADQGDECAEKHEALDPQKKRKLRAAPGALVRSSGLTLTYLHQFIGFALTEGSNDGHH